VRTARGGRDSLSGRPSREQVFWNLKERYEVFVPREVHEQARAIAEEGTFDFSDTPEDQKIMELPAEDGVARVEDHYQDRSWDPEDAIVEVWSEKAQERAWFEKVQGLAWMIELSLSENQIPARIDAEDGSRRIFVLPEDESRAREIVREITNGTPPT
jgi:hypothetical protein